MTENLPLLLAFAAGLGLGALAAWLARGAQAGAARALGMAEAAQAGAEALRAESERRIRAEAELARERQGAAEKLALLSEARETLSHQFQAVGAEALRQSADSFLTLARQAFAQEQERAAGELAKRETAVAELVKPVRESLDKLDGKVSQLEAARQGAYQGLLEQVQLLRSGQEALRGETGALVRALRTPDVRGRWGEMQLRRVVELAGMKKHVDFEEQETAQGDGGALRPDLVVKLPGGRCLLVDAKVPLDAWLDAVQTQDDAVRARRLADHARQLRDKVKQLAAKSYTAAFDTPELVVLFVPGEAMLAAALDQDGELLSFALEKGVAFAAPTTLLALLKAAAYGWWQHEMGENARQVGEAATELHKRLVTFAGHVGDVGAALQKATRAYNSAISSFESRLMPQARRLEALGATGPAPLEAPEQVELQAAQAGKAEVVA
ncbi:MAG TPA: DNA recombination protein RmuC [Anaeromyxobacteraceae bacterium]|jgi:DNA recombination protein RmuC|nr:DNA recombination protein RmuC [Anaeromyxobacteraceae bacterium]